MMFDDKNSRDININFDGHRERNVNCKIDEQNQTESLFFFD